MKSHKDTKAPGKNFVTLCLRGKILLCFCVSVANKIITLAQQ
jgi:hypothetical protein